jgi:hypothetical protein
MDEGIILKKLLRQDRAVVIVCTAGIAPLLACLVYQGRAMRHMDLVTMAMPSTGAWPPWTLS